MIHPDDTGKDTKSVESLQTLAKSEKISNAVVANHAFYATAAQTTNPNVGKIAKNSDYSDLEKAKEIEDKLRSQNKILIIALAVVGGVLGFCGCAVGGYFGVKAMNRAQASDVESGNRARGSVGYVASSPGTQTAGAGAEAEPSSDPPLRKV